MSGCPKNTEWVLYVAGELPPRRTSALREHMDACESCRREVRDLERGMMAMASLDRDAPARPEAIETLRRRLRVAAANRPARTTIFQITRRYGWMAAAAGIILAALLWTALPKGPAHFTAPRPAPVAGFVTDVQVQEELAEIAAGVEILEHGDNGQTCDAAPVRSDNLDQELQDEFDRLMDALWADTKA
jgi:anti-sigma factor RsiW